MTQVKKLDFTVTTIFCGVDVHKKNWRVNIQDSEFKLEDHFQHASFCPAFTMVCYGKIMFHYLYVIKRIELLHVN